ncbi:MAG TPA: hypothetical protein VK020_08030, partial [Microlunatus sp.]|nr:hypothetical protein [Microlunatus sp.]
TELPAVLEAELGVPVATWRTEPAVNDFPSLPVRDVRAFVWLAVLADRAAYDAARDRLERSTARRELDLHLAPLIKDRRRVQLQPTARSAHPAP